jgi:hypothetical protein
MVMLRQTAPQHASRPGLGAAAPAVFAAVPARILAQLGQPPSRLTAASLHEAHAALQPYFGGEQCPHRRSFTQAVLARASYIGSQGWLEKRIGEGVTELESLRSLVPQSEAHRIDTEISALNTMQEVILHGRRATRQTLQPSVFEGLLHHLKKLLSRRK